MTQAGMQTLPPPQLSSVPAARHWVLAAYQRCCGPGVDTTLLALLTTEAVANAVLHGRGEVLLELSCSSDADGRTDDRAHHGADCRAGDGSGGSVVRVAVSDGSPQAPVLRHTAPAGVGGRGVALIDALSSRWGVQAPAPTTANSDTTGTGSGAGSDTRAGKTVWFELPTRP